MTTQENILDKIRLNRHKFTKLGVRNVGLFGSYSRNEQLPNSDIDLLIDFDPEKKTLS